MASMSEAWITGPQSTKFYTRTYLAQSPKALLVFVHGFADHIGRYEHVHTSLADRGISVFTFDQRGFGKTALDSQKRSPNSSLGKTSGQQQMEDLNWALKHAEKETPGLPIFLMGQSMGGGEVLSFVTQTEDAPHSSSVALLSGIISSAPLIKQTKPASKLLRRVGGMLSVVSPYTLIPTDVNSSDISHDPACNEAYLKDPLVKQSGTLRGVADMLNWGEHLLAYKYKNWPSTLPVLFIHGTGDKVTSFEATQAFYDKIDAKDKKILLLPGAYHEPHNEPEGGKDIIVNEVMAFIETHLTRLDDIVTSKL